MKGDGVDRKQLRFPRFFISRRCCRSAQCRRLERLGQIGPAGNRLAEPNEGLAMLSDEIDSAEADITAVAVEPLQLNEATGAVNYVPSGAVAWIHFLPLVIVALVLSLSMGYALYLIESRMVPVLSAFLL